MSSVQKLSRRPWEADGRIDDLEYRWWNDNAGVISRVWEMHDEVSATIRRPYARQAKAFFLGDGKVASVLELGCGSGWVGQMIAGPSIRIHGTDFSESQIALADANAERKRLGDYCDYSVSSPELPADTQGIDGVLIHCFLHHLSGKEVEDVLSSLRDRLAPGTRVWVYEPAFYSTPAADPAPPRGSTRFLLSAASGLVESLGRLYSSLHLIDAEAHGDYMSLAQRAELEGWYLSPKEVPFDVDEFTAELERDFHVARHYWATIQAIGWAYQTNLVRSATLRRILNRTAVRSLVAVDRRLSAEAEYLRSLLTAPNYAFHVWECVSR